MSVPQEDTRTREGSATGGVLSARGIRAHYVTGDTAVQAVDGVSLDLHEGEVLGIAGESGCGKSTLAAVLALVARPPLEVLEGEVTLAGQRVDLRRRDRDTREIRGRLVSLLPQGAMNSLNPTSRIKNLAYDVIHAHEPGVSRQEAWERTEERLEQLSLPVRVMDSYPHQLSGGMRQRVVAVISTLLDPAVLIADEPTSALDVSAQHTLVQLLRTLLERRVIRAVAFITHDLPLLSTVADRIAIMYAGELVEVGSTGEVLTTPDHPYTRSLLDAVLTPDPALRGRRVEGIPGAPPDLRSPPAGCRFHPRCPQVMDVCTRQRPPVVGDRSRFATCWWVQQRRLAGEGGG